MKLAIVGCRHYQNYYSFEDIVNAYIARNGKPSLIISGGASGVDTLAERYAAQHSIPIVIFEAQWNVHGKKAGPMRNRQIVDACTHMLALPSQSSVGTYDSINKAKCSEKHVTVHVV